MQQIISIQAKARISEDSSSEKTPTLSSTSYNGGALSVKGYKHPVFIDLDGLELPESHPIYKSHNQEIILGQGQTVRHGDSLVTEGELTNESEHVSEVVRLGKRNFPFQASVGVQPLAIEEIRGGKKAEVNGQTIEGPAFIARTSYLYEVSVVPNGADRTTTLQITASKETNKMNAQFRDYIVQAGFTPDELEDKQLDVLRAAYDAQNTSVDTISHSTIESVIEAAKNKEKLHEEYGRIVAKAIEGGMDSSTAETLVEAAKKDNLGATEFELQVLRASRPSISSNSRKPAQTQEVVEAALARTAGDSNLEANYKPEVLEASEKHFKHGLSIVELLQMAARANGFRDISHRDTRALLKASFAPVQAATSGASTYDVAGILSNVNNKMIRDAFNAVESEWRKIAEVVPTNDLKEMKTYSLTGDFVYKEIKKGGEITHATMGEESYSNQPKTYGRMFQIDRSDLINDDLGAFNRVRRMLGRGAALSFNQVFWTAWLSDVATFWTAGRNNYLSGASSSLDVDSLSNAVQTFESMVDPDGNPMALTPAILLVGSALKVQGSRLVNDGEIRVNGASAKTTYTTSNPHAGKLDLAASTYLNNSNIPNGSANHWWLLAHPQDMPSIQVAHLYGRETPFIESADADFDTLGICLRGYHDVGVAKMDYRASVMSAGQ